MAQLSREQRLVLAAHDIGYDKGMKSGITKVNDMYAWLFDHGRIDDAKRAADDSSCFSKLIKEYEDNLKNTFSFSKELLIMDQNTAKYMIDDLREKVKNAQAELKEKEAKLAEKEAEIADKDAQISDKDAEIADIEAMIANKEAEIAEKESLIFEYDDAISKNNTIIGKLQSE